MSVIFAGVADAILSELINAIIAFILALFGLSG